jgi:Ca2+-binding RTX toxin-like protein
MAVIVGNFRNNEINGTIFGDFIRGLGGHDEIEGRGGADRLWGGAGWDELEGGGNEDILLGHGGNDELEGGMAADQLHGGVGDDELDGGQGNDILSGSAGADVFDFDTDDSGRDIIVDWTDGDDRLDITDYNLTLGQALARGTQVGAHVQFDLVSTRVVVQNADLATFGFDDFIL